MTLVDLPLKTSRLTLRAHRPEDAVVLQKFYSRADVAQYLLEDPWTAEKATEFVTERLNRTGLDTEAGAIALVVEHDGEAIGDVMLWYTDRARGVAEIGWTLDPDRSGRASRPRPPGRC